jgi:hypothetical protein
MSSFKKIVFVATASFCVAAVVPAKAALIITEVMSQEQTDGYNQDWFELTNTGSTAVSTLDLYMSDSSGAGSSSEAALRLSSGSIGAGQSVVFIDNPGGATSDATLDSAFETSWFGSSVPSGFQIGDYTQTGSKGIAFSSSGDSANVYDGLTAASQLAGVKFGSATRGVTFDNTAGANETNGTDATLSTLSKVGTNGAFETSSDEIGSPGHDAAVTPEPSTWALMISGVAMLTGLQAIRRRNRANS